MSLATILIDPGYTLLIGILFGIAALRNRTRAIAAGVVACALFGVGVPVIFYLVNPDWMWMYTVDPAKVPTWFVAYVFALYFIPFFAGFAWTPRRGAWAVFVGAALLEGALMFALRDRYGAVSNYADFQAGKFEPLMGSKLSVILNVAFGVSIAGILGLWFWARRSTKSETPTGSPAPQNRELTPAGR